MEDSACTPLALRLHSTPMNDIIIFCLLACGALSVCAYVSLRVCGWRLLQPRTEEGERERGSPFHASTWCADQPISESITWTSAGSEQLRPLAVGSCSCFRGTRSTASPALSLSLYLCFSPRDHSRPPAVHGPMVAEAECSADRLFQQWMCYLEGASARVSWTTGNVHRDSRGFVDTFV